MKTTMRRLDAEMKLLRLEVSALKRENMGLRRQLAIMVTKPDCEPIADVKTVPCRCCVGSGKEYRWLHKENL
jgi:hypothetical protein